MSRTDATSKPIPTVNRVMGRLIVELVFDQDQHRTGFAVTHGDGTWSIEDTVTLASGEILKPYSPGNNLIAHQCVVLPSKPEPSGTKDALLADIAAFLHRYVDLSPVFEQIAAHYILLTWLYDAFAEVPYLRLRGEYGTGKTRALIAIGSLCCRAFFAAGVSTVSPIFHTLDRFGGTLVLDEADLRFSDATADLVKLFNNGNVKGIPVLRTMQNRDREFNPVAFNVFGPKIIAMRGAFEDEALESRFLTEETGMRKLPADIPLHLPESFASEALRLRNRLLHYRLCHRLTTRLHADRCIPTLGPRRNQIVLPLLSLMDDQGLRGAVGDTLLQEQRQLLDERSQTLPAAVLRATLRAFGNADGRPVSIQAIANAFNAEPGFDPVSPRRIGATLKGVFRIRTRKSNGIFMLDASEVDRLLAQASRYGIHSDSGTMKKPSMEGAY